MHLNRNPKYSKWKCGLPNKIWDLKQGKLEITKWMLLPGRLKQCNRNIFTFAQITVYYHCFLLLLLLLYEQGNGRKPTWKIILHRANYSYN